MTILVYHDPESYLGYGVFRVIRDFYLSITLCHCRHEHCKNSTNYCIHHIFRGGFIFASRVLFANITTCKNKFTSDPDAESDLCKQY